MNIKSQSPLELIFTNGDWESFKIDQNELSVRRKLISFLNPVKIKNWICTSDAAIEAYGLLYAFLKTGKNDRFLLYCPVEIIPDISLYKSVHENIDNFIEVYVDVWHRLLNHYDVKANFINGDVPDIEIKNRSMPRIIQAVWLVKPLLEKGLISKSEIDKLKQQNEYFAASLEDIEDQIKTELFLDVDYDDFNNFVATYLKDDTDYSNVSKKRESWLRSEFKSSKIKELAQNIDLNQLNVASCDIEVVVAAIDYQFFYYIDNNPDSAYDILKKYMQIFSMQHHACVKSFLWRLYNYTGINYIFNFRECKLDCVTHPSKKSKLNKIKDISHLIFPVLIFYGSRIKGYSEDDSDYDIAVIVKDGVSDFQKIDDFFGQKVLKYKTKELHGELEIIDSDLYDPSSGSVNDAHVLFNGVWVGDPDIVSHLSQSLLKPIILNHDVTLRHRAELERDLLQYRLLHKGYERFNYVKNKNVFMDTGYRCVASSLYLSKIFDVLAKN